MNKFQRDAMIGGHASALTEEEKEIIKLKQENEDLKKQLALALDLVRMAKHQDIL